jgi:hypothetical protein
MDQKLIDKNEKSREEHCALCDRCAERKDEDHRELNAGARVNSELYGKEVENYYFYFLTNKAS